MKVQQDKTQKSLKRIEGQVRGIQGMYADNQPCLKIVQQIAAAREALSKVGREMLKSEACSCMVSSTKKDKFDKILKQLFKS
jgi:CsoR family transcriptional regulator, copper-sensing transcriptional repressor